MDNYPDGITSNDIDKHYSSNKCCELCRWWYEDFCILDLKIILDELYTDKEFMDNIKPKALKALIDSIDNSCRCWDDCCTSFVEA